MPRGVLRSGVAPVILAAMSIAALTGGCNNAAVPVVQNAAQQPAVEGIETWDAEFMQGVKVGFVHTIRRPHQAGDGRQLVEIDSRTVLGFTRDGQINSQEVRIVSIETTDARLVSFHSEASLGPTPQVVDGIVQGGSLELRRKQDGQIVRNQIPWPADALGFSGLERTLQQKPMQPGERRQFQAIFPFLNQVATCSLVAIDYEETPLLADERSLLRIECATRVQDAVNLKGIIWVTPQGEMLKTRMTVGDELAFRCTRAEALSPSAGKLDLFKNLLVRPKQPLHLPPGARRAQYVVRLRDGNPSERFPQSAYQSVEPIDGATAKLTVWAAGPLTPPQRADLAPQATPGPEYLATNNMLQIHDLAVMALAESVLLGAPGSAERAVMLERAIFQAIANKNYSQAFATAAEVARSREGDCTEHAVLLAAVARASAIPSRVAVGLVYDDLHGGFLFHMWTEVYVNGHWLPLDATRGQGGIGVTHLKLADSSLASDTELNVFMPVAEVLGQLDVEPAGE